MSFTGIVLAGGKSTRFSFNKLKIKVDSIPLFIDQIFKLSFFCDEIIISTSRKHYPVISSEINKINLYKKKYNFERLKTWNLKIDFKDFLKRIAAPLNIKIILDENSHKILDVKSSLNAANPTNPGKSNIDCRGAGPIIGIYSSLINASCFYSLVTAFDMPFISYNLLKSLIYESGLNIKEKSADNSDKPELLCNYYEENSPRKDICVIKSKKGFEALCGLYSKKCLDILKENIKKQKYKISDIFTYLDTRIITNKRLKLLKIDDLNFLNINHIQDYYNFKNIWQNKKTTIEATRAKIIFSDIWNNFFFRGLY